MADVDFLGTLAPPSGGNQPIVRAENVLGAFVTFADATARDAPNAAMFREGQLCRLESTGLFYERVGAAWVAFTGFGGSGGGGGMGFRFTYSTTTTDSDPGAGTLRGNDATLSSVTQLYVDLAEYGGTDVTAWLDSLDDYPGTIKGIVRLSSQSDPTKWIEYVVTLWTTATGYRKLTVTYKDGPGGLLTTAGDTFVAFDYATSGQVLRDGSLPLTAAWDVGNQAIDDVKSISYEQEVDNATSTIDFTTGGLQKKTLAANTTLATPTPPPPFTDVRMRFIQAAAGGPYTLTFWGGISWVGSVPTMPPTASAELIVCGYHDGTTWRLGGDPIPSQLPARGQENVVVDLYPSGQSQGTLATATTLNVDVPIAAGRRYKIVFDVWVDDGAGGACLFAKALAVVAHQTGGVAVLITNDATHDNAGAGWTLTATGSTTNVRFALTNASGSTRSYNYAWGAVIMDKP
jgi:hypothetical protein